MTPGQPTAPIGAVAVDYDPFAEGVVARVVPTTEPQREIWLADQLGRDASLAFNESVSLHLRGRLDEAALRNALVALVQRHDALRANIGADGQTLCLVDRSDRADMAMPLQDLSGLAGEARDEALRARQRSAVETPFLLQHDRLFRAELVRLATESHVLILTAHHVVCDGWSWWVFTRELASLYAQAVGQPGEPLPPADGFADYALAEASRQADPADEAYWLDRFEGELPVLDLPLDRPRPARRSFTSAREDYVLDADLVAALRKAGSKRGASLFATLLATFAGLLSRLTGQSRIVVGIPAAGQSVDGHERLVGHCVNTLPLLFDLDPSQPIGKAIDDAQATLLDAIEHQRYTYGTLLRKLRIGRDPSRLPLINVMFNIDQALDLEHAAFPGLEMDFASNPRAFENFEVFINAVQEQGRLRLECQYNTDLFDASTMRHWMGHWRTLLEAMAAGDGRALGELPLLTEIERRQVLEKWNDARSADHSDDCVHELFERQVAKTPDAPALSFRGDKTSYAELNARANHLARHLRNMGVEPDDRVALCAQRGIEMVVGMLAILKAGGAYVPLDPAYPVERLRFMVEDSAPRMLLAQAHLLGRLDIDAIAGEVPVAALQASDDAWRSGDNANLPRDGLTPAHLAYVIYTSGSTGKPKGVMLEHASVCNYLGWALDTYRPERGAVVSSSFAFDATVTSLYTTLLCGGMVRMLPEGEEVDGLLAELSDPDGCGLVKITPAHLEAVGRRLQAIDGTSHVDVFVVGGEALPAATVRLWRELQPGVRMVNEYGPTETVVGCCVYDIPADQSADGPVPIGRAIGNMRMYLLGERGEPVPIGVTGEIHIGGPGVARGYLNRPELTAERFVQDPFARQPGARMYRTGDLGRWRADGNIEYLGRNDFQVKVRGYRVELGEIEAALASHPAVEQAVVVTREDRSGDVRLAAYIVPTAGSDASAEALARHLHKDLPEYMVPQHFVALDALPLTNNAKVDRAALPAPELPATGTHGGGPRDALEVEIAAAMRQVLGVPELGIDDDFFALGGHSLLAAQLTTRLNRDLKVRLSLRSVFDAPTVSRMAALVREASGQPLVERKPITRRSDQGPAPLSPMQERCRLIEAYSPGNLSYNGPSGHRLRGPLDVEALDRAFRALARRQTVLRTSIGFKNGEPVQIVHREIDPGIRQVEDLSMMAPVVREAEVSQRMRALVETPFHDLGKAPLFVARLYRMAEDEHVLFFMPHHIIWDGWSFDLLYADLSELYAAEVQGRAPNLPELPVTYGDFSAWYLDWMQGPEYAAQVAFWRARLGKPDTDGERPRALPTDMPRKRGMSGRSSSLKIALPADVVAGLHAASRRMDNTLFVTLLSAYYALLSRMGGLREVVVGTPVRGRNSAEVEGLMGYFTNLLPIRKSVDPVAGFDAFAGEVKAAVLDSFAHPDVRLEDLSRELSLRSEGGGSMLYHALFSFQDVRQRVVQWGDIQHSRIEVFTPGATEDFGLWFVEEGKGLTGGLIYNAEIFHDETARVFARRYEAMLRRIAAEPGLTVEALTCFEDGQADRIGQIEAVDTAIVEAAAIESAAGETAAVESAVTGTPNPEPQPDGPDAPNRASGPVGPEPREVADAASRRRSHGEGSLGYLLDICAELLDTEVAAGDNFFDLGGNSMLAVQAAEQVYRDTGVRIKLMRFALQDLSEIAADLPSDAAQAGPAQATTKQQGWMGRLLGRRAG